MANDPENLCRQWLERDNWRVFHRGWPDFFCEKNGKIRAVEVKASKKHSLTKTQQIVAAGLCAAGIPVYRWTPDGGLSAWERKPSSHGRLGFRCPEAIFSNGEVEQLLCGLVRASNPEALPLTFSPLPTDALVCQEGKCP